RSVPLRQRKKIQEVLRRLDSTAVPEKTKSASFVVRSRSSSLKRYLLAACSSLFVVLIFPSFNVSWLAWICLTPLALASFDAPPRRAFFIGWFAGTLSYLWIFEWLFTTYRAAHQSVALAALSDGALSAYLGLYWGAWCWFLARTSDSR